MTYAATGLVVIHAVRPALEQHVQWTVSNVLNQEVFLDWTPQPGIAGSRRTELLWQGLDFQGAHLTSALAGWKEIYFEVTQDPIDGHSGSRWCHTPELGIRHRTIDELGNIVVGEDEMRAALSRAGSNMGKLQLEMRNLLAEPWDSILEPLRHASADARVVWLQRAV